MKVLQLLLLAVLVCEISTAPAVNNTTELTEEVSTGSNVQCLSPALVADITKVVNDASPFIKHLGNLPAFAATSCAQILAMRPSSNSSYYWIQEPEKAVRVFCHMNGKELYNEEGVWMKIADINMTKTAAKCPNGLEQTTQSSKTLCRRASSSGGCSSIVFSTHGVPYTKVCGRVIGYQYYSPDAFYSFYTYQSYTIDNQYVDGVSITQKTTPRQHIWTFAAGSDEVPSNNKYSCPCTNSLSFVGFTGLIPEFVGNDYFCETGTHVSATSQYYFNDPLWDGKGCGRFSTCCDGGKKPWFCKELPEAVENDIEVRVCRDSHRSNEDILIEIIELYVQ